MVYATSTSRVDLSRKIPAAKAFGNDTTGQDPLPKKPDFVYWPSRTDPTCQVVEIGVPFVRNKIVGGVREVLVVDRKENGALTSRAVGLAQGSKACSPLVSADLVNRR